MQRLILLAFICHFIAHTWACMAVFRDTRLFLIRKIKSFCLKRIGKSNKERFYELFYFYSVELITCPYCIGVHISDFVVISYLIKGITLIDLYPNPTLNFFFTWFLLSFLTNTVTYLTMRIKPPKSLEKGVSLKLYDEIPISEPHFDFEEYPIKGEL